jgi:TetR/AcrR family transcriptional repressor of nem operon
MAHPSRTREEILDVAERLVQTRGFNGFSYAHVADELGMTKASVHYHFPAKSELGSNLIRRYRGRFLDGLAEIDRTARKPMEKLRRYAGVYADALGDDRMCLCGMLAAEHSTLPEPMQKELRHFFSENERWLGDVLEKGRRAGELQFSGRPAEVAGLVVSALEGAMMLARSYGAANRFRVVANRLIGDLAA